MFRNTSRISQHLRSLLFGASVAAGVTMAMGGIVGCADENDPETHVKYLQDTAKRTPAVNRLVQFFEDAMTKDKGDRNGPSVKPLLDKIVEPMSQTCVNDDLDEKTRSKVVKFLSDARDPRGGPCLIKTLKDYKPDSTEEDVRAAARGVGPMKLKEAAGPLFEAFTKIKNSKPKAQLITLDVTNALVELSDPAWETQCVNIINKPINDRKDMNLFKDELYWQVTCARILGNLKSANAVKPLLKIMLSPIKADLQATSMYALIKTGKPAIDPALKLLKGEDTELVEYAKVEFLKSQTGEDGKVPDAAKKPAETAYLNPAALVLGSIGREEAAAPMIEALNKADDTGKVIIARELLKLPLNADVMKAVQTTYEKTPPGLTIPPGANGREALLERMSYTFDANLVPWIVTDALAMKGDEGDLETVRAAALQTSMKLMKASQVAEVDKLYDVKIKGPDDKPAPLGKAYEKEYKATKDLLTACGDKIDCYMAKLSDPNTAVGDGQIVGIKAAYMVGVLGSPDIRAKLADTMPKIANDGIRFASVQVIDHFAPKGDADSAAKLQKIIDDAEATKDQKKIQSVNFFKEVVYRLNARQ